MGRNLDLVSVADVYSVHRDRFTALVKEKTGVTPTAHVDYRELLAEKDLDAVCVATPDHWHAKQTTISSAGITVRSCSRSRVTRTARTLGLTLSPSGRR